MKMKLLRLTRQSLVRFTNDRRGSVPLLVALGVGVFIGVASLAVDSSFHYVLRGELQAAADSAVLAAVGQLPDPVATRSMAQDYAAKNLPSAVHGTALQQEDVVLGNWAEQARTFTPAGNPVNAVQVTLRRAAANGNAAPTFFARVFGFDQVDIAVSAVATTSSTACMLALNPNASGAVSLDSNAEIDLTGCIVHVNSSNGQAMTAESNSDMSADEICVVGDYTTSENSHYTPLPDTGCNTLADPLASLAAPAVGSCDVNNYSISSNDTDTLSPGVYCGGIEVDSNASVHFEPGTYIIKDGEFEVNSNANVDGAGVTFYLTGAASILRFESNGVIDFYAPTSGAMAGVVFFQDPNYGGTHWLESNANTNFEGVLYLPNGTLHFNSNAVLAGTSPCTILVADSFHFDSNARFAMDFDSSACSVPLPPAIGSGGIALRQ